jgi:hypothetical protein
MTGRCSPGRFVIDTLRYPNQSEKLNDIQLTQAALAADYLRGISLLDLEGAFPDFPATSA